MEFNLIDINESFKEIEVKLSYDEIKDELTKELKKKTQSIQIDGFRKGKVPQNIIKKLFGDALEIEASEKIANKYFWDIVEQENIRVIDKPVLTNLNYKDKEKLDFKIKFEIYPNIEVKEYTNIEIEVPDYQITEDELNLEIEKILEANRTYETVEQVGEDLNYLLEAEIIRTDETGNVLEKEKSEIITIDLTKDTIHPDIIENSKFKKAGDSFQFSFSEQNQQNQTSTPEKLFYNIKILNIKKIIKPQLTDELVKNITKDRLSTVEEFREDVKKNFQKFYDEQIYELTKIKLMGEIVKRNDFTPPKVLVDNLLQEYLEDKAQQYKKSKLPFNKEEAVKNLNKNAENEVKWYMIRDEIIKKENISVTDQEIEEEAQKESEKSGLPVEKIISYFNSSNKKESLLNKKLIDFLIERNNIKKVIPKKNNEKEKENEK